MTPDAIHAIVDDLVRRRPQLLFDARDDDRWRRILSYKILEPQWLRHYDQLLDRKARRYLAIEGMDVFQMKEEDRKRRHKELEYLLEEIQVLNNMRDHVQKLHEMWEDRYFNAMERFQKTLLDARAEHIALMKNFIMLNECHHIDQQTIAQYHEIIESLLKRPK